MYQLITQKTKFKGQYLYYAKYTQNDVWGDSYWFSPTVRRIYIRTQLKGYVKDDDKPYVVLIADGGRVAFPENKIPKEGTFSVLIGNDTIISTSKQEVARFFKKAIFKGMTLNGWSCQTSSRCSIRQNKYKKCIEALKKLK